MEEIADAIEKLHAKYIGFPHFITRYFAYKLEKKFLKGKKLWVSIFSIN